MIEIPTLDDVSVVFSDIAHMPKREDIPDEFWKAYNPFAEAISEWFFNGGKFIDGKLMLGKRSFVAKPGTDAKKAVRAIKAILSSFAPKHEHKEAACAYLLCEWFDIEKATAP